MRISRGVRSIFSVAVLLLIVSAILTPTAVSAQQEPEPREEIVAVLNIEVLRSGAGAVVVPVRVTVLSRRAIEGTLELRAPNANVSFELPVGLAANSEVSQTFVVPTAGNASIALEATLVVDGEVVAIGEANRPQANANAVGVLGVAAPSDSVQLQPQIGQASLIEMDDLTILPALDTVVASDAGLRALSPGERAQLLRWVAAGRQLAVADSPGSIDSLLPPEWQSDDSLVGVGTGFIRYIGTDWVDNVPAGVSVATSVQLAAGFFDSSSPELRSDAGFTVPGLGVLSILLLVYLLVAGPIAFVVLSVMKRQTLAWVVLPALAVIFAGGVFGVGRALSSGRGDGYATIVEVSPVGETVTDTVLIAHSGQQTLELPEGWALTSTALSGDFGQVGAPVVVSPTRGSTNVRFDIDTGSGGSAVLTGSTDSIGEALAISDLAIDGVSLTGTVRNSSGERLENVAVMVGERVANLSTLDDGASEEFVLDLGQNRNQFASEVATWEADPRNGFGNFGQDNRVVEDGVTNGSVWLQWRAARLGTAVPEGMVTAVGWSRDLDNSMVDGNGRTAVVAHAALPAPDGPVVPAQIRVINLAVPAQDGFGNFNGDFDIPEPAIGFDDGVGNPGVLASQFVRPAGSDTSALAVEIGNQIGEVHVWTSDEEWRALPLEDAGQNVTFTIPEQGWIDDVLTVRYTWSGFFGEAGQLSTRLMPVTPRTVEGELLDAGETSPRDFFDDVGFPGGEAALGNEFEVVLEADSTFEGTGDIFGTYDVWFLDLQEGDQVIVRMLAGGAGFGQVNLDPFLSVRDPDGGLVAENDDDGNGLNSRLEFTARTNGTFSIETRPLGGLNSQGAYQVTIDVTPVEEDAS